MNNQLQGCLLGQLVRPEPQEPLVSSFAEITSLIGQKQAVLNLVNREFVNSRSVMEDDVYTDLRMALVNNPPVYLDSRIEEEELILRELGRKRKVITFETMEAWIDGLSDNRCDSVIVPTGVYLMQAFMLSPRLNQSTIDCLNNAIVHNFGYILAILEEHRNGKLRSYGKCRREMLETHERPVATSIRMIRLLGCFALFGIGSVISVLYFGVEMLISRLVYLIGKVFLFIY